MGWHAAPTANGKWAVRKSGAARASKFFFEKDDARAYALMRAAEDGTTITVHRKDGSVEEQSKPEVPADPRPVSPGAIRSSDSEDIALYVQPDTLARLMTQERVRSEILEQETVMSLLDSDPIHPGRIVRVSREITANAVHARRWLAEEGRYIFEYIGDI